MVDVCYSLLLSRGLQIHADVKRKLIYSCISQKFCEIKTWTKENSVNSSGFSSSPFSKPINLENEHAKYIAVVMGRNIINVLRKTIYGNNIKFF